MNYHVITESGADYLYESFDNDDAFSRLKRHFKKHSNYTIRPTYAKSKYQARKEVSK